MITEETFYRPAETSREVRHLPAPVYNLAHLLLAQSETGSVFVPIRSMQYMAVLDAEECIFVHREGRRLIELAWRNFRPGERGALSEAVAYDLVYYSPSGSVTMARLQGEFYTSAAGVGKETITPIQAGTYPETRCRKILTWHHKQPFSTLAWISNSCASRCASPRAKSCCRVSPMCNAT